MDSETKEDLYIMKQNTERLLNLTNQLLDFRKTETRGFRLNFTECDVVAVLRETYLRLLLWPSKRIGFILVTSTGVLYGGCQSGSFGQNNQ